MAAAGLFFVMMGTMAVVLMVGAGFFIGVLTLHYLLWGRWMGELSRKEQQVGVEGETVDAIEVRRSDV